MANAHTRRTQRRNQKHGCGIISKVDRINRKGEAVIKWLRPRVAYDAYTKIDTTKLFVDEIAVPLDQLYNIEFYKKGDYKTFFEDKRTRKNYMKWAPFMLAAEEFLRGDSPQRERLLQTGYNEFYYF